MGHKKMYMFIIYLPSKNFHQVSNTILLISRLLTDLSEVFIESNLTKLEKIHLEHNDIDYINEPKLFCEISSLYDIHLSLNNISDLNLDVTCLKNVI